MTDTTEVIAVSFGEQEDEHDAAQFIGCMVQGKRMDFRLGPDRLTNGTEATNCCVMGPYILFKEADQPFPTIVFGIH